jgi:predicted permease
MAIHEVVLQILIPVAVGLGLRTVGLFGEPESAVLRKLVVYVSIPFLVFHSMYTAKLPSAAQALSIVIALPLLTGIFHLIGRLVSSFEDNGSRRTALMACITFGNYGWLGWSAVYTVLGEQGLNQAFFFTLLWWPVFYGFGALLGTGTHQRSRLKLRSVLIVTALPVGCIVAGILLNVGGISLPDFLLSSIESIGDTTIPLILISVGMGLRVSNLKPLLVPSLVVSAIRLGLGPLLGIALAQLLPVGDLGGKVILLQSAMPVATVTPILCDYFAMDRDLVSVSIVTSTILSLGTLPIILRALL